MCNYSFVCMCISMHTCCLVVISLLNPSSLYVLEAGQVQSTTAALLLLTKQTHPLVNERGYPVTRKLFDPAVHITSVVLVVA